MDERAILNHEFTVAAYTVTWVIQLAYLGFLAIKWRAEKRSAGARNRSRR
ncbi:MAG TPA: hypothetical protein VGL22_15755 [Terracidiphilus sp.]|jgi:hypothetical protein